LPDGPPPADFTDRIRSELEGTLARVREAASLPWQDLTATTLAEMRFNSIAGWLPRHEANALRAGFQIEMTRLYAIAAEQDEAQVAAESASEVRGRMAEAGEAKRFDRTGERCS